MLQAIENKEGDAAGAQLQYTCRCSFLQIYNEQISDLLHPAEKPLALRYDSESGVYVENLTEHVVVNSVQLGPCSNDPAFSLQSSGIFIVDSVSYRHKFQCFCVWQWLLNELSPANLKSCVQWRMQWPS